MSLHDKEYAGVGDQPLSEREALKRFALYHYEGKRPELLEDIDGEWVPYDEHEKLRAALEAERDEFELAWKGARQAFEQCQTRVQELETAVREPVRWFAEQMERKLRENDHKSHWRGESVLDLWPLMRKELDELNTAFAKNLPPERIVEECADVANYLMMLADNVARAACVPNAPTGWRPE